MPCVDETDPLIVQRGECPFPIQGRECPIARCRKASSFSVQKRECLLYMEQRDSSRRKGECISLPDSEDDILLLSAYESVLLVSTERMTHSFSVHRRECVLYTEEGVSFCYQ